MTQFKLSILEYLCYVSPFLICIFPLFIPTGKSVLAAPSPPKDSPGEMGKPVTLPANMTEDMKKAVDDGWQKNAFNQYVSDMISVHRTLPDPRDAW